MDEKTTENTELETLCKTVITLDAPSREQLKTIRNLLPNYFAFPSYKDRLDKDGESPDESENEDDDIYVSSSEHDSEGEGEGEEDDDNNDDVNYIYLEKIKCKIAVGKYLLQTFTTSSSNVSEKIHLVQTLNQQLEQHLSSPITQSWNLAASLQELLMGSLFFLQKKEMRMRNIK